SRAALQYSVGAEAEVRPGRTRLTASWALALWAFWSRVFYTMEAAIRTGPRGHRIAPRVKSVLFGSNRRKRLVRLTGWTPRGKSSNRTWQRGSGSEPRTHPSTLAPLT